MRAVIERLKAARQTFDEMDAALEVAAASDDPDWEIQIADEQMTLLCDTMLELFQMLDKEFEWTPERRDELADLLFQEANTARRERQEDQWRAVTDLAIKILLERGEE